jgi:uncharacterized protein DUF4157
MTWTTALQRRCACGTSTAAEGECAECSKKSGPLQRTTRRSEARVQTKPVAPAIVHEVLHSPGKELDPTTRAFMEERLGHDFSRVRVHVDGRSIESAQAVNALAYTVGRDVVFGAGQYQPMTAAGRHILAHELAHVVQQGGGVSAGSFSGEIGPADDSYEREAEESVKTALRGEGAFNIKQDARTGLAIRRQAAKDPDKPVVPERKLPPHRPPKPPRSTEVPAGVKPCLTGKICEPPIPGSAWDFGKKAEEESGPRPAHPTAATEVKKAANDLAPGVLKEIHEVTVNPGLSPNVAAQVDSCKEFNVSTPDKSTSCMEVPKELEAQAARFNKGKSCLDLKKSEDDLDCDFYSDRQFWAKELTETMTHEAAHIAFERRTPVAISSRTKNEITLHELSELFAQLSEFPVHYRSVRGMVRSQKDVEEAEKRLEISIKAWVKLHVESEGEGIRGMLTKIRCLNPCEKVAVMIQSLVESITATWPDEIKNALLQALRDADKLDWPVPAPSLRPEPEHPKMPPLYQPRGTFVPEIEKSVEDLP